MGSDTLAGPDTARPRIDHELVSRFATCCRALGLAVNDRRRPADLAAARTGFQALTHIAHDHCDAWTGLAAAGDVSVPVIEAIWRTSDSAGLLQRQLGLAVDALGFTYDTGLYLQFRATTPADFQLAYATVVLGDGDHAQADRLVSGLLDARPGCLRARWLKVVIAHRAGRWSDVVRLFF